MQDTSNSGKNQRPITFAKMERTIRPAIRWVRPEDMNELVRLCAEHAEYERSSFDPVGKEEALARMLFAPDARLRCLVRPEARNKGIGRALMQRIAQEGLAQGIIRMQWQTPSFNVDAIRFYDRLGPEKKEKFRIFLGEEETRALASGH
jgi:GNAT superfamily N-acetyltransferase